MTSVNPYNTKSEEQLHIPEINTVKYGTRPLKYNALKALIKNGFISSYNASKVICLNLFTKVCLNESNN